VGPIEKRGNRSPTFYASVSEKEKKEGLGSTRGRTKLEGGTKHHFPPPVLIKRGEKKKEKENGFRWTVAALLGK